MESNLKKTTKNFGIEEYQEELLLASNFLIERKVFERERMICSSRKIGCFYSQATLCGRFMTSIILITCHCQIIHGVCNINDGRRPLPYYFFIKEMCSLAHHTDRLGEIVNWSKLSFWLWFNSNGLSLDLSKCISFKKVVLVLWIYFAVLIWNALIDQKQHFLIHIRL